MNAALARIGAAPIMAETEDTELAAQVVAVYYDRVDAILGMHPWKFARQTFRLDEIAPTPDNGYDAAAKIFANGWKRSFALPGTRIGEPRSVLANPRNPDYPLRDYAIEGDRIYADTGPLWVAFTVRVAPAVWASNPLFRLAATTAVAADLAVPVTHDKDLAAQLLTDAEGTPSEAGRGGMIGRAMAHDLAGAPIASPLQNDPLTAARFGGQPWHGRF
jgi:hypothetical protein